MFLALAVSLRCNGAMPRLTEPGLTCVKPSQLAHGPESAERTNPTMGARKTQKVLERIGACGLEFQAFACAHGQT